jgi:hypothetical protein
MIFWFDDVRRDVSYAARGLARNPGFATAVVVTLALGIGATTAVFSVVNAVLLRPLPYPDSDRLVRIVERLPARDANTPPGRRTGMTWTEFSEWRARTTTLSAMAYGVTPPITGVVEDMRQGRLDREPAPQMFVDYRQVLALTQARKLPTAYQERLAFGFLSFVVRTPGEPAELMPVVRSLVARVDPSAGIDAMLSMEQLVASSLTRQRFYALMLGIFAAIAAALGAIGTYGVLAYAVARRTNEIGIRMALGAQRGDVLRLVIRRGVILAVIGIVLGLAGAAGLSRSLTAMLYGLTPLDPTTYIAVTSLFAVVTTLASYVPARRAARVDPMDAIRCE